MGYFNCLGNFNENGKKFYRFKNDEGNCFVDFPEEIYEFFSFCNSHTDNFYYPFNYSFFYFSKNKIYNAEYIGKHVEINCNDVIFKYIVKDHVDVNMVKEHIFFLNNFVLEKLYTSFKINFISTTRVDEYGNIQLIVELDCQEDIDQFMKEVKKLENNKVVYKEADDDKVLISLKYHDFDTFPCYLESYKFLPNNNQFILVDEINHMYPIAEGFDTSTLTPFTPPVNSCYFTTPLENVEMCFLRTFYDSKNNKLYQIPGFSAKNFENLKFLASNVINFIEGLSLLNELSCSSTIMPHISANQDVFIGEFSFSVHINIDFSLLPFSKGKVIENIKDEFTKASHQNIKNETLEIYDNEILISGTVLDF